MRFRVFGVRVVFIVGLACVVLLLQMLAVSQLGNSQRRSLWEDAEAHETSQPPSLRSELPPDDHKRPPLGLERPPLPKVDHERNNDARAEVRGHDRVLRHVQQLDNSSHSLPDLQKGDKNGGKHTVQTVWRPANTTTSVPDSHVKTNIGNVKHFPVPPQHRNCDIKGKKDAQSALNRASSLECKVLIHNITCLQQAGLLYDTDLRRECGVKTNGRKFEAVSIPEDTGGPTAKIVFLFSLHGRAFRQVKRLFKAVYHRDHYYFVHIDSRSDYLHRKLYEAFSDFPNVYFPTWRIATIWGGASLLQMLLRSLEDLEYILTNWKWDYFINLSESDYPLRTNGELVNFLKAHSGDNFVKTHGADIKKFVQKQGLDRTFVECDNHMWRVDNRKLPGDITVDGGSDWIAIHRNYSRYLVTDRSRFLTGLKRYYEFSLLPAESFFHTVLRNGPMCETFVKTNLRVTNWNRKLGCRCQYKHIVDWCGCSPNDFLSKDLGKLQSPGDHHFFARKFEAIVNLDVINRLDSHLYGSYPGGSPALSHFWENVYHVEDDVNYPYNARYSTYQSFLRQALSRLYTDSKTVAAVSESCAVPQPAVVKEVTVLMVDEAFKGLIVTLREESSTSLSPPEFEVLFTPVDYLKKYTTTNDIAKRVYRFEVGSDWDGKESIFRNYGGILGAWDNPVAAVRLIAGRVGDVTIVWEDPTGARVSSQSVKVESGWFVTFHKPKLERPIRPGVWNSRVELTDGTTIMERKFLVVPLTHENMNTMEDPTSVNAARENDEVLKDSSPIKVQEWKENVRKTGKDLEQWLDKLVGEFWKIESVCRTGVSRDGCSYVSECASTDWSTFSPDPKSELGQVKWDGRIR